MICWPEETSKWKIVHYNRLKSYYTRNQFSSEILPNRSQELKTREAVEAKDRDQTSDYFYYLLMLQMACEVNEQSPVEQVAEEQIPVVEQLPVNEQVPVDEQQDLNSSRSDEAESQMSFSRQDQTVLEITVIELNPNSKTHEDNVSEDEDNGDEETTEAADSKVCPYCAKTYTYRKSFNKHIEKCPKKQ
jgi:hypothetical protein